MEVEDDLWRWTLEFIIRQQLNDDLLHGAISAMAHRSNDPRLLKTLSLQALQCAIKDIDSISETVLESIENVEELDRKAGTGISNSLKVAYCAVAIWCTVKHVGADGEYFGAVRRIWKTKVEKLKGESELYSEELGEWRGEIEAALVDEVKWRRLAEKKRRVGEVALAAVRSYLEEAWVTMGPPFLESVAKELLTMENSMGVSDHSREVVGNSDGGQQAVGATLDHVAVSAGDMLKLLRIEHEDGSYSGLDDRLRDASPTLLKRKLDDSMALEGTPIVKRRRARRWTIMEEDALRSGVKIYGVGNWKVILLLNQQIFEGRTEVDLKDKWRNMMR